MAKQVFRNTLDTNDNLYVLSGLNCGLVDLIYLDPPFNSKRTYSSPVGSKAAGDYYENYQLLCSSCNRIKGDRPMEYLRLKIETRERMMKNQIFFGD